MLRIEFQIRPAGIPLRLFDTEAQVESIEIDNALPVAGDGVFLFLTAQFDTNVSVETLVQQLPEFQLIDATRAEFSDTHTISALSPIFRKHPSSLC